jgi:hypothetical protein
MPCAASAKAAAAQLRPVAVALAFRRALPHTHIISLYTAFGHALGAFLRADLPSLRSLNVNNCILGDEGMTPLLDGLAANTQLHA